MTLPALDCIKISRLNAGGTLLTLQGRGFPTGPFQTLAVNLLGAKDRTCIVQSADASVLQCMVSLYADPLSDSAAAETFEIQLTANGEPAECSANQGCQLSLGSPEQLEVLGAQIPLIAYEGNVTILLGNPSEATGKNHPA